MNITLTPEMEDLVQKNVEAGHYHSASHIVNEALRLLKAQQELDAIRFHALKRDIAAGIEQLERGESMLAEEVFKRLHERTEKANETP